MVFSISVLNIVIDLDPYIAITSYPVPTSLYTYIYGTYDKAKN